MSEKLVLRRFNEIIDLNSNNSYLLVVENRNLFYKMLSLQINEIYENDLEILSDDKKASVDNKIDIIPNLFSIEINSKKNLNALYKQIKSNYSSYLENSIKEVIESCNKLFETIFIDYDLELYKNIKLADDDILKILNIRIKEKTESLVENILSYIKTTIELRKIKVFIFIGLINYLSDDDIHVLVNECKLLDIILINYETNDIYTHSFDKKLVLDKDLCLL